MIGRWVMIGRWLLALILLLIFAPSALAEERILNYHSDIEVFAYDV